MVFSIGLAPQALTQAALQRAELPTPAGQLVRRLPQALLPLSVQRLQGVQLALPTADLVPQLSQAPVGQRDVRLALLQSATTRNTTDTQQGPTQTEYSIATRS